MAGIGIAEFLGGLTATHAREYLDRNPGRQRELFDAMARGEIGVETTKFLLGATDDEFADWVTMEAEGREHDRRDGSVWGVNVLVSEPIGQSQVYTLNDRPVTPGRTLAQALAPGEAMSHQDGEALRVWLDQEYPVPGLAYMPQDADFRLVDLPDLGTIRLDLDTLRRVIASRDSAARVQEDWRRGHGAPPGAFSQRHNIWSTGPSPTLHDVWRD